MHRFHVLDHAMDASHESWSSPDGAVLLLRDRGSRRWRAAVDLVVVTDAELLNGGLAFGDEETMTAATAEELADRLAHQERIHLVFRR